MDKLEKENRELRRLFPLILQATGNGSFCLEDADINFLKIIPKEVRLVIEKKDEEIQCLKSGFDKEGNSAAEHCCEEIKQKLMEDLAEADRRAGNAERLLASKVKEGEKRSSWFSKAKEEWGVSDNVSFDKVWEEALRLKKERKG